MLARGIGACPFAVALRAVCREPLPSLPPKAFRSHERRMTAKIPDIATTDAGWCSRRVSVPVPEISYVACIFEAYDNEFLVRTETQGLGVLRIWYPASSQANLENVLREMRTEFPITILSEEVGMAGLDEVYPE